MLTPFALSPESQYYWSLVLGGILCVLGRVWVGGTVEVRMRPHHCITLNNFWGV